MFQTSLEVTKMLHHTSKSDFLLTGAGTITPKAFIKTKQILENLHCSLSKIKNNKQVLVYGVLESTNDFMWTNPF